MTTEVCLGVLQADKTVLLAFNKIYQFTLAKGPLDGICYGEGGSGIIKR